MYNPFQWGDNMLSMYFALLENPEDEPLFEAFYNEYKKLVYYIAFDRLGERQLSEDCVQEVFIKLAKNFHNIKDKVNDNRIEGLVRVVAKNMAIDIYRRNKSYKEHVVDADLSKFISLSEDEFDICDEIALKQAINNLPEEIKTVFYLKYVCDYSGAEISKFLDISEPLVRKRCMIGKRLVREYIESDVK